MIRASSILIYINPFRMFDLGRNIADSVSYAREYADYAQYLLESEGHACSTVFSLIPAEMKIITPALVRTDRFTEMYAKACTKLPSLHDGIATLPSLGDACLPDRYIEKEADEYGIPVASIDRYVSDDPAGFVSMLVRYRIGLKDSYYGMHVHRPRGERGPRKK